MKLLKLYSEEMMRPSAVVWFLERNSLNPCESMHHTALLQLRFSGDNSSHENLLVDVYVNL